MLVSGTEAVSQFNAINRKRWRRDPGVTDFIEHMRPKRDKAELLTSQEIDYVRQEIQRCKASFEYAARNYFWIMDKQGREILFTLWDSQELILESLYELRDKGMPQKLLILKSRQLGCSTLIEALMAWLAIFFNGKNLLIVSNTPEHAGKVLFSIILYIVDRLPWWLKPLESSREIYDGILFSNPDPKTKGDIPGNESRIFVAGANKKTGVGQGTRVSGAHISEISDFEEKRARSIVEGDLGQALVESPDTIAVIESTGKIDGSYYHKLWNKNVELGERAGWTPRFFPWFFDRSHFIPPPDGWVKQQEEADVYDLVLSKWVQCDNDDCRQIREALRAGKTYANTQCPVCNSGTLQPKELTDGQLYWWENRRVNAGSDEESMKELLQEQALTPEDAFQTPGASIFPLECIMAAGKTERDPIVEGFMDESGNFHGNLYIGVGEKSHCYQPWCDEDHSFANKPIQIWEFPEDGSRYYMGGDVGGGLGGNQDHSVAYVARVGMTKDTQVATFRTNILAPEDFAGPCVSLARWYNNCEIAMEANKHDRCSGAITERYDYQNVRIQRDISHGVSGSRKYHWYTTPKTKANIFVSFVSWLRSRSIEIRSANLVAEMKSFVKEDEHSMTMGASGHRHDDELMAAMICLFCAHEDDWDENTGAMRAPRKSGSIAQYPWVMTCKCGFQWGADKPQDYDRCPICGSVQLAGKPQSGHKSSQLSVEDLEAELAEASLFMGSEKSLDSL